MNFYAALLLISGQRHESFIYTPIVVSRRLRLQFLQYSLSFIMFKGKLSPEIFYL